MTKGRIVAIGTPPAFRQQVARALGGGEWDQAVQWAPSVITAETVLADGRRTADVLVVSPSVKDQDAFGLADFVNRRFPSTAVVLVRARVQPGLLAVAMRRGIRDVVDLSRGSEELRDALERALAWSVSLRSVRPDDRASRPGRRGRVVPVFSSKGGTGKSFLASNLATAIASQTGTETALLDVDVEMGDVFSYFGEEPRHPFDDLVRLGDEPSQPSLLALGRPFYPHLWGFGAPTDPGAGAAISGESVGTVLRALRGHFDTVVVDCPANYSDHVLATFDMADAVVLVMGLDVVGVRHLATSVKTLVSLGVPRERLRVVLNRADSKVGLEPSSVERVLGLEVDAMIPSSRLVPACLNRGRPAVVDQPRSDVARAVAAFARTLAPNAAATTAASAPAARPPAPADEPTAARRFASVAPAGSPAGAEPVPAGATSSFAGRLFGKR